MSSCGSQRCFQHLRLDYGNGVKAPRGPSDRLRDAGEASDTQPGSSVVRRTHQGFMATLRHSRRSPGSRCNSRGPTESEAQTRTPRTLGAPPGGETRREGKCLSSARSDRPARCPHCPRSDRSRSASPAHGRSSSMRRMGDPRSRGPRPPRTSHVPENFRCCEDSELCRFSPEGFKV